MAATAESAEMTAAATTEVAAPAPGSVAAATAATTATAAMLRQRQSWSSRYRDPEQQGARSSHYILHGRCSHKNHPIS
jgi:hypothetical protein